MCRGSLGGMARCALVATAVLAAACSTPLRSGLSEHEADRLLVLLSNASIAASKELDPATRRYRIEVSTLEVDSALRALEAGGALEPSEQSADELLGKASLVPTPAEERARHRLALEAELSATLERIDSVIDARVHLSLPRASALDEKPPPASAAVLLRRKHGSTALDEQAARALIAAAVTGLEPPRVSVVQVEAAAPATSAGLARVGPFSVARASAPWLRAALFVALGLNAVLALLVIATLARARRS